MIQQKLNPESLPCKKCNTEMTKVYPLSRPSAKFQYYMCPCSPKEKTPLTRDTLLYCASIPMKVYIVLLCGFAFRYKYNDVRRAVDIEGQETYGQAGDIEKILYPYCDKRRDIRSNIPLLLKPKGYI